MMISNYRGGKNILLDAYLLTDRTGERGVPDSP